MNYNILLLKIPHALAEEDTLLTQYGMVTPEESPYSDSCYLQPYVTYRYGVRREGAGHEVRRALFTEFLSHHPYPRWHVLIDLLERLEEKGYARAGVAQEVKEKYLRSE